MIADYSAEIKVMIVHEDRVGGVTEVALRSLRHMARPVRL